MSSRPFKKIIWMLWLQGEENAPELVKRCIESWRVKNPTWSVELLSETDVAGLWETDEERLAVGKMSKAALSDLVRMKLLVSKGGVWADATTVCNTPLDFWLPSVFAGELFAFSSGTAKVPIESYFLAAAAGTGVVTTWYQTSLRLWLQKHVTTVDSVEHCEKYARRISQDGRVWQSEKFWLTRKSVPYYWAHYLFDFLLANNAAFKQIWDAKQKLTALLPLTMQINEVELDIPMDDKFMALIQNTIAPLHKLNWRSMDPEKSPRVRALLEYCCRDTGPQVGGLPWRSDILE